MERQPIRIYVDTSVFGGVFDKEFAEPSKIFLHQARRRVFDLATSGLVEREIQKAPANIRELYSQFAGILEIVELNEDCFGLQQAYLAADIVSTKYADDALHVAVATVAQCSVVVSWNFKHIVNYQKVPKYNAVNVLKGFSQISIWTPLEVIGDENEENERV